MTTLPAENGPYELFIAASGQGWGFLLSGGGTVHEECGAEEGATPHRAELRALLAALPRVGAGGVTIHTANENLRRVGQRAPGGRQKHVEHLDLVQELWIVVQPLNATWLLADRGDPRFERAKELARRAARAVPTMRAAQLPVVAATPNVVTVASDIVTAAPSGAKVVAYTDGGCRGNPGVGGWAFLLVHPSGGQAREQYAGQTETTNNRMELTAAINALSAIKSSTADIEVRTDSLYVIRVATEWMKGWKARGWQRSNGEQLLNVDLVQALDSVLSQGRSVEWTWVRGHAGEPGNEYVDALTNRAMDAVTAGDEALHERRHVVSPVQVPTKEFS